MIPREVREAVEKLREEARKQFLGVDLLADPVTRPMTAAAYHAYDKVLRILDEHDAAHPTSDVGALRAALQHAEERADAAEHALRELKDTI